MRYVRRLALHRQSRQRRYLPGDGLVGRRQAGARPRQEAGKGVDIVYSIPREGAIANYDVLAIPADAPHVRNAHLFINFLLRPDIAARNSNLIKYANARPAVRSSRSTRRWRTTRGYTRRRRYARGWSPSAPRPPQYQRLLTRMWTRFKTGK